MYKFVYIERRNCMKTRRILCIALAVLMMLGTFSVLASVAFAEENGGSKSKTPAEIVGSYVKNGLVSLYSGAANTESGYDAKSDKWYDLVGNNDITIKSNDSNYFTETGFKVKGDTTTQMFPQAIVDLINGQEFTVEILFDGPFTPVGASFGTFMNSSNDKFALFRQNGTDQLVFKFAGNTAPERPKVDSAKEVLSNGLISITYKVGGKCTIYCNGVQAAQVDCKAAMGANNLFIGQSHSEKVFDATYSSIRFYNRELTSSEVFSNAVADGKVVDTGATLETPGYVSVAQPKTNIVGDVAMVRPINSAEELDSMMKGENLPASALYTINDKLEVLDDSGKAFSTVRDVLVATEFKVLSCFNVTDMNTADALATYLKKIRFFDAQVMSANKEVLKYVREQITNTYGILDMRADFADKTELTKEDLLNVRRAVKTYNASVAILPVALCTNENVQYLYDRQVNVWAFGSDTPDANEQYFALLSGAVGIVSDATASYLDIACNQLEKNTMTRLPINIGHRGIPSKSPENCIEGAQYAYELGAEVIEIDVYLTSDNQAVLMHDPTTGRTCNEDLTVATSTLAELTALYCNKGYENNERFKNAKVPSLDDFLAAFRGTDVRFYIEVKTGGETLAKIVKELVEKNDMYGQVSVISFNGDILKDFRNIYPEMSVGGLCMDYMQGEDPESDFRSAMSFIGKINATLNPRYTANGALSHYDYSEDDLRTAMIRGIQIHPWTFQGLVNAYANHFIWGYAGLTGDNADSLAGITRKISLTGDPLTEITVGKETDIFSHAITTYKREQTRNVTAKVKVVSGDATVDANGTKFTANTAGEIAYVTYSIQLIGKYRYNLYTQPLTVNAVEDTPVIDPPANGDDTTGTTTADPTPAVTEDNTTATEEEKKGCGSAVGSAIVAIAAVGAAFAVSFKKKED